MGFTEVLKVVVEDKASDALKRIARTAQEQFGLSDEATAKLDRKMGNFFGDTVVDGAMASSKALVGFGIAAVGGLGALIKTAYDADAAMSDLQGKMTGFKTQTALQTSVDGLSHSIGAMNAEFGRWVFDLAGGANKADELARAIDRINEGAKGRNFTAAAVGAAQALDTVGLGHLIQTDDENQADYLNGLRRRSAARSKPLPKKAGPETFDFGDEVPVVEGRSRDKQLSDAEKVVRKREEYERDFTAAVTDEIRIREARLSAFADRERAQEKETYELVKSQLELIEQKRAAAAKKEADRVEQYWNRERAVSEQKDIIAQYHQDRNEANAQRRAELDDKEQVAQMKVIEGMRQTAIAARGMFDVFSNDGATAEDKLKSIAKVLFNLAGGIVGTFGGPLAGGLFGVGAALLPFATGGVARAASGMRVPGIGHGDSIPALLKPNEVVVPDGGSHPSFIDEVVMAAQRGGGSGAAVTVNMGYLVPPTKTQTQTMTRESLVPALQNLTRGNRARLDSNQIRGTARGRRR